MPPEKPCLINVKESFISPANRIETDRLVLDPFSCRHFTEDYIMWLNNPKIVRYSENRHRHHDLESCLRYQQAMASAGNPVWAIEWKERAFGHIGNIAATIDRPNSVADVAIMVGESAAHGHGLATEAWRAVCRHLFNELGMRKVTAGTMACNQSMRNVAQRVGMIEDGRRAAQFICEGRPVDLIQFALFESA